MNPSNIASRFLLLIFAVLFSSLILYVNLTSLQNFMLNGVVSPINYSPENIDLISQRLPVYLALFFKYRYYWDFYSLDLLFYVCMLVWVFGGRPKTIVVVGMMFSVFMFVISIPTGINHPIGAVAAMMKREPPYVTNDKVLMLYGESDVASLYLLNKNADFLTRTDIRYGLLNVRKTLSMDEVLDYYLEKQVEPSKETK